MLTHASECGWGYGDELQAIYYNYFSPDEKNINEHKPEERPAFNRTIVELECIFLLSRFLRACS